MTTHLNHTPQSGHPSQPRRGRRVANILGRLTLWLAISGFSLWCLTFWVDSFILVPLQALIPWAVATLAFLGVLAALARWWVAAAISFMVVAALTPATLGGVIGSSATPADDDILVFATNLEIGQAEPASVMAHIRQRSPDLVMLSEVTPEAHQALSALGLTETYPYYAGWTKSGASGTMLLSKYPVAGHGMISGRLNQPVAKVTMPRGDVLVVPLHTTAPTHWQWEHDIDQVRRWVEQQPPSARLIVAGDFNATYSHPRYRQLAQQLTDAHRQTGKAWFGTWPVGMGLPPFIRIDHVLFRGFTTVDAGDIILPGTDHAAVWARLSWNS